MIAGLSCMNAGQDFMGFELRQGVLDVYLQEDTGFGRASRCEALVHTKSLLAPARNR